MGCENGSRFILHIECYWAQFSSNIVLVRPLEGRGDSELLYSAACNVGQLLVCYHTVNHARVLGSCISTTWLGPSPKNWDPKLFWDRVCISPCFIRAVLIRLSRGQCKTDNASTLCSALTVLKKSKSCDGQVYFSHLAPRTVSEITCIFLGHGLWISMYIHICIKWKLQ